MKQMTVPNDFFACLREGKIPTTIRQDGKYSEILVGELVPFMIEMPYFRPWFEKMDIVEATVEYASMEVPVLETRECLSRTEVATLSECPRLVPSLFQSLTHSLLHESLPYEEVFAIVMDAMYTMNYKHYKTLGTEH